MPESNGTNLGVTIGAREIYDLVHEVRGGVQEVRGDVRSLTEKATATDAATADLTQRLAAVERWIWSAPAALLTGIASVVTVVLTALYIK